MIMIKSVIFDFDGVIVDTETGKFNDFKVVLEQNGVDTSGIEFSEFIGKKRSFFLRERFPDFSDDKVLEIVEELHKAQSRKIQDYKIIEGLKELLEFLKSRDYSIAICTGSGGEFVNFVLDYNSINHYFDIKITGDMVAVSKPDPECFEVALEQLKCESAEAIVIEDSAAGVAAAKKIGCNVFGLLTYVATLEQADRCFKNHLEILEFLNAAD
ncbi:HAD family phosphatase [Candidatus Woesearchaeota archaeon]|nr:HAD family phosphatase [Candidatus Woesearchaeota archaeon]